MMMSFPKMVDDNERAVKNENVDVFERYFEWFLRVFFSGFLINRQRDGFSTKHLQLRRG